MTVNDVKVIIPTCDKYIHIIEALAYTVKKYWQGQSQFIILGYKEPQFKLDDNWSFVSMGEDTGAQNWSNGLIKYFTEEFKDEYFINMIDDTVMTRQSNLGLANVGFNYMIRHNDVKKIFLQGTCDLKYAAECDKSLPNVPIAELDNLFWDINQGQKYRTATASSIWSVKYFLETIKPNMSPWEYELQHIVNDGARILTTCYPTLAPTMYGHLCGKVHSPTGHEYFHFFNKSIHEDTYLPDADSTEVLRILKVIQ